jgi:hypothetical protein
MTKRKISRKLGRPRKKPGDVVAHKILPKMQIAITAIVEQNLPRAEAAKIAGLTEDAIRKAMRDNGAVRAFYSAAVKALMTFAKAKAAHALITELTGNNATARVAAARIILEDSATTPAGNGMPQVPGFAILIADARAQALPVGPVLNQISRQPALLDDQSALNGRRADSR